MSIDASMVLECEWQQSFMLAYTFETNILRSIYGHEQRSALIEWARRVVKYDITFMSTAESAYFARVMSKYQGDVFGVPVWGEQGVLTDTAPAVQAYVDLTDVDKMNFEVGGLAVLYNDWEDYEIKEIDSMTTTRLTFTSGLAGSWPSGSLVYPMLHMTVDQNVPYRKATSSYGGASLVFKEAWNGDITHWTGSHSFPTYKGYTVFNKEPNWVDGFNLSITRPLEYLQKFGVQLRYVREPESEFLLEANYLWDGVDECSEVKGLFDECKGKWKQFWTPTWQRDIVITDEVSSGDDYLIIEDIEYEDYWAGNVAVGKYLFLLLPDGTEIYREIIGWPSSTRLNLDVAVGHDVAADSVHLILGCFLVPCRFEIDEMEMKYHKPFVAETNTRIQSLHDETMTTTTTTTTTV